MRGRVWDGGLREVARDASQLLGQLVGVDRDRSGREERRARGDGRGRRVRGEVDGDVRRDARTEVAQALVVEGGDRTEARVRFGELSPAGAGLVDLERRRQLGQRGERGVQQRVAEGEDAHEHERADDREVGQVDAPERERAAP
jgi:hypothetical protein